MLWTLKRAVSLWLISELDVSYTPYHHLAATLTSGEEWMKIKDNRVDLTNWQSDLLNYHHYTILSLIANISAFLYTRK